MLNSQQCSTAPDQAVAPASGQRGHSGGNSSQWNPARDLQLSQPGANVMYDLIEPHLTEADMEAAALRSGKRKKGVTVHESSDWRAAVAVALQQQQGASIVTGGGLQSPMPMGGSGVDSLQRPPLLPGLGARLIPSGPPSAAGAFTQSVADNPLAHLLAAAGARPGGAGMGPGVQARIPQQQQLQQQQQQQRRQVTSGAAAASYPLAMLIPAKAAQGTGGLGGVAAAGVAMNQQQQQQQSQAPMSGNHQPRPRDVQSGLVQPSAPQQQQQHPAPQPPKQQQPRIPSCDSSVVGRKLTFEQFKQAAAAGGMAHGPPVPDGQQPPPPSADPEQLSSGPPSAAGALGDGAQPMQQQWQPQEQRGSPRIQMAANATEAEATEAPAGTGAAGVTGIVRGSWVLIFSIISPPLPNWFLFLTSIVSSFAGFGTSTP